MHNNMNLSELNDFEREPPLNVIQWLQRCYLLPDNLQCAQCNREMELTERTGNHVDGFLW